MKMDKIKKSRKGFFRKNLKLTTLTFTGFVLLLICLIPVIDAELVINTSTIVKAGAIHDPYETGTVYHTRVLCWSVLNGDLNVEGSGIYLQIFGYNTNHLHHVFVKGKYNFTINPADDLYIFTFNNTGGKSESLIMFKLEEIWITPLAITSPVFFLIGLIFFLRSWLV